MWQHFFLFTTHAIVKVYIFLPIVVAHTDNILAYSGHMHNNPFQKKVTSSSCFAGREEEQEENGTIQLLHTCT